MNYNLVKKKYLKFLNTKKNYKYKKIACEICGSKKTKILKKKISWNNNRFGELPVCCCESCGFVFQNPRFEKNFYINFYQDYYRKKIYNKTTPSKEFINDQLKRGKNIYNYLKKNYSLPRKGRFLDVGCSIGLMLKPLILDGWDCYGNDPDLDYVKYGKEKFNLPIEFLRAEDMSFAEKFFDVILIAGSLEHCFDPNKVLKKCSKSAKKGSLLILEARGEPRSTSKYYFNHNHHRYFSMNSLELIMIKHGWKPVETTMFPISGPTREGGIWCIGEFKGRIKKNKLLKIIKSGKRETYKSLKSKLRYFDIVNNKIDPNRGDYRNIVRKK